MKDNSGATHVSVLGREVVRYLQPVSGGIYVDGTLGLGGHARLVLEASAPGGRLIGLDWDEDALLLARRNLAGLQERIRTVRASYAELPDVLAAEGVGRINGLVLDLGVSSLQLDRGERGFSFRADAPLDMRMDIRQEVTAAHLLARLSREELADIFYNYGEERQARRIAAHIVGARMREPVKTTRQLADLVAAAIPRRFHPKKKHVATRVFQALRIAVNRELDNLVRILTDAPSLLVEGGRVCVITFHSLEDRIVKRQFADNRLYRVVTARPVVPGQDEVDANPRARSARLRVAERRVTG